ncbi:hypothetical protein [Erythrobacter sp. R86502]|uniref:hypothetical protein n=1 Tax=Erythrobacter sp. R86502 TaxID=3093846 RepID=UPI0036D35006
MSALRVKAKRIGTCGIAGFALWLTSPGMAQDETETYLPTPIPDAIRAAILAEASVEDAVAWAPVGDSGYYVSYLRGPGHCGSGGCRARVWRMEGNKAKEVGHLSVGHLPLAALWDGPESVPALAVTVSDRTLPEGTMISSIFADDTYGEPAWDYPLPAGSGDIILSETSLTPVETLLGRGNARDQAGFGILPGSSGNFCTGFIGKKQAFTWDFGDPVATIRFNGKIRYPKVPQKFLSPPADASSEFDDTQWLADDLAIQVYEIAPVSGGVAGPESDAFTVHTVSFTGVGERYFDRVEMKIHCGS